MEEVNKIEILNFPEKSQEEYIQTGNCQTNKGKK